MTETQNNIKLLHRKEWQTMMPVDVATTTGAFLTADSDNISRFALYMSSATVHYLYDCEQDSWLPIASGAFSPALAAGACGTAHDWSPSYTATGGTTATATVALNTHNINNYIIGSTIEFLTGTVANIGLRRTVTNVLNTGVAGSTITITFSPAVSSVVANNDTFRTSTGSFFIFTSGTLATSFKRFDIGTMSWSAALSIAGLAATWGTDARMISPVRASTYYDSGSATNGTATYLEDNTKNWGANQWVNYQLRITTGSGIGQIKVISSNSASGITIPSGIVLNNTSTYTIEGDENAIYLMGNNLVTTAKYSVSGNTWANLAPTVLRSGSPVAGMTANFVGKTGDASWADITNIKDGRYIYSFRGATSVLDRLNINGGTSGSPTWEVITYQPSLTTFAAGTSSARMSNSPYIYIVKDGSGTVPQKVYAYDAVGNTMVSVTSDWYLGGAALLGNKAFIRSLSNVGAIDWLYVLQSTSNNLRRIMLY